MHSVVSKCYVTTLLFIADAKLATEIVIFVQDNQQRNIYLKMLNLLFEQLCTIYLDFLCQGRSSFQIEQVSQFMRKFVL